MTSWLDDLQPGAQVIVNFVKASMPELALVPAYVERISGRGTVIVKYTSDRPTTDRFVDGENRELAAKLMQATPQALAAIAETNRVGKLIRMVHTRMRNLDFVRSLSVSQLEAIDAVVNPPKVST